MDTPQSLDDIFSGGGGFSKEEQLDATATRLLWVKEQIKMLRDEQTGLEDKIWTLTPEEPGEFAVEGKQYSFVVARTELWKWNNAKLETLSAGNPHVGAVVKSKFTLGKKEFADLVAILPHPEKVKLEETLTRTVGKPRIKITKKA